MSLTKVVSYDAWKSKASDCKNFRQLAENGVHHKKGMRPKLEIYGPVIHQKNQIWWPDMEFRKKVNCHVYCCFY